MSAPRSPESSTNPGEVWGAKPLESGIPALPIRPGDVIGEKYVVEKVIGAGGVGVVVSARHTKLDERVAIKFVQTSAQSLENLSRFEREARAASRIRSEHVARVMDFGSLPTGAPFMVLEHLDGVDLGALLKDKGRIPYHRAVDYLAHAAEGVAEAHALGIVHRDLKPANLFLTKRPDGSEIVKVLDFGISKLLENEGRADLAVTQASSIMGSPLYMSPEQMESPRDAKMPSDIWSLGVILYELITGGPPFEAATMPLLCAQICCGLPTPMGERFNRGSVPGSSGALYPPPPPLLEAAVMRCLERDPSKRPATVADLVRSIAPFGSAAAQISSERLARIDTSAMQSELTSSSPGFRVSSALTSSGSFRPPSGSGLDPHLSEPVSERRRWSWADGLGEPPQLEPEKRSGATRNIAALGIVLALGFGLGAWGMAARVGAGRGSLPHARGTAGRAVVLASRGALLGVRDAQESAAPVAPPIAAEPVAPPTSAASTDGKKEPRPAPARIPVAAGPAKASLPAKAGKPSEVGHEITDVLSER